MNWEALGAVGEILGAVAVVTTLFYLAQQVQEAKKEIQSTSITTLNSTYNDAFLPIYNNEQNIRIWVTGLKNPDELTEEELEIFFLFMHRLIGPVGTAIMQNELGTLAEDVMIGFSNLPKQFLNTPGGQRWLDRERDNLDPRVESMLLTDN